LTAATKTVQKNSLNATFPTFVDFFAGSGLVTAGTLHARSLEARRNGGACKACQ